MVPSRTPKTRSLLSKGSALSSSVEQLRVLGSHSESLSKLPRFSDRLAAHDLLPLKPTELQILQVNVGKMCNQRCRHCHVDAGPDRTEIMTKETMQQCLDFLKHSSATMVDLTGGAPEMNPHFRWFVEEISALNRKVLVRCNLTIVVANSSYRTLPEFYKKHSVTVVSSLPHYDQKFTDRQRGDGVFEDSIEALRMLNGVGYGEPSSGLELDLVYNPSGAFLPASQEGLERDFKRELESRFGISFNKLFTITNLPISRFLEFLVESGNLEEYMSTLVQAFNPSAARGVMCRNTLSVGWDGTLYDCDFNQMLDLPLSTVGKQHISVATQELLQEREIILNQHCYGCTAGAGSSCGGSIV